MILPTVRLVLEMRLIPKVPVAVVGVLAWAGTPKPPTSAATTATPGTNLRLTRLPFSVLIGPATRPHGLTCSPGPTTAGCCLVGPHRCSFMGLRVRAMLMPARRKGIVPKVANRDEQVKSELQQPGTRG